MPKTIFQGFLVLSLTLFINVSFAQISTASIYKEGWIDFNKNGKMDVFEDPKQPVEKRVEDLLSQMNLDEKPARWLPYTAIGGY